jgi:hypothetical protein
VNRVLAVLAVLVIGVVVLGFYLGWFSVSTSSDSKAVDVNLTVDKEKLREDEQKAKKKLDELKEKAGSSSARSSNQK